MVDLETKLAQERATVQKLNGESNDVSKALTSEVEKRTVELQLLRDTQAIEFE